MMPLVDAIPRDVDEPVERGFLRHGLRTVLAEISGWCFSSSGRTHPMKSKTSI